MFIVLRKRTLVICMCLGIFVLGSMVYLGVSKTSLQTSSNQNTNWGLGFSQNGCQPTGNATKDFLKQYNAYFLGESDKKVLYITFDAGYENGYTPQILEALKIMQHIGIDYLKKNGMEYILLEKGVVPE